LETVRVHEGLDFVWTALNLDKKVKIADLAEVNTIPLQLQINFTELCEDICGLWQPRYRIYDTLWQSTSVCSNRRTNSLHHYPSAPHCL